jgi:hypothetical protein
MGCGIEAKTPLEAYVARTVAELERIARTDAEAAFFCRQPLNFNPLLWLCA